jgi:hypothetical protein
MALFTQLTLLEEVFSDVLQINGHLAYSLMPSPQVRCPMCSATRAGVLLPLTPSYPFL